MRYPQKVRILVIVDAVLALVMAAAFIFSPEARSARSSRGRLFEQAPGDIWSVEIRGPTGDLTFRRFGGSWIMDTGADRLPARAERVEAFLEAVANVRTLRETARSDSAWKSQGLEDDAARRIRLSTKDGGTVSDFWIGRYSPDGASVYIREEGRPRTYSVAAAVASRLPSDRRAWLDLRVFGEPVPVEDVQSLRVAGSLSYAQGDGYQATYTLTRNREKGWASKEITDLDAAAAERLVRAFLYAEGEDFDREGLPVGAAPGLRIDLELGSGTLRTLWISGKPDAEGGFRATMTGSGRSLRIGAWTLKSLLKGRDELRRRQIP